jgi:hypothetical protein
MSTKENISEKEEKKDKNSSWLLLLLLFLAITAGITANVNIKSENASTCCDNLTEKVDLLPKKLEATYTTKAEFNATTNKLLTGNQIMTEAIKKIPSLIYDPTKITPKSKWALPLEYLTLNNLYLAFALFAIFNFRGYLYNIGQNVENLRNMGRFASNDLKTMNTNLNKNTANIQKYMDKTLNEIKGIRNDIEDLIDKNNRGSNNGGNGPQPPPPPPPGKKKKTFMDFPNVVKKRKPTNPFDMLIESGESLLAPNKYNLIEDMRNLIDETFREYNEPVLRTPKTEVVNIYPLDLSVMTYPEEYTIDEQRNSNIIIPQMPQVNMYPFGLSVMNEEELQNEFQNLPDTLAVLSDLVDTDSGLALDVEFDYEALLENISDEFALNNIETVFVTNLELMTKLKKLILNAIEKCYITLLRGNFTDSTNILKILLLKIKKYVEIYLRRNKLSKVTIKKLRTLTSHIEKKARDIAINMLRFADSVTDIDRIVNIVFIIIKLRTNIFSENSELIRRIAQIINDDNLTPGNAHLYDFEKILEKIDVTDKYSIDVIQQLLKNLEKYKDTLNALNNLIDENNNLRPEFLEKLTMYKNIIDELNNNILTKDELIKKYKKATNPEIKRLIQLEIDKYYRLMSQNVFNHIILPKEFIILINRMLKDENYKKEVIKLLVYGG